MIKEAGYRVSSERNLRILLYGDFAADRLASSYQRAFTALGHQVIPVDIRQISRFLAPWLGNRLGHRLTIKSFSIRRAGSVRWNRHVLDMAAQAHADLAFILNGEFLMPQTLHVLRARGTRVFVFHADNPFPPHYANRPETLSGALATDCYFVWSPTLVTRLRKLGVVRAEYLPFAWDPEVFPFARQAGEPEYELVFVGGWDQEREAALEPLARRFNLKIWGPPYWASRTRANGYVRRCWQGKALVGAEAARVLANSKIVLNILRKQNLPDGVVMRTFEVPGCGGFLLSTRTTGANEIFPENRAGAYFSDVDEAIQRIQHFLSRPEERCYVADEAHTTVQRGHTYVDRAEQVLQVLEECAS